MPRLTDDKVEILLMEDRGGEESALEAAICGCINYRLVKARTGGDALALLDKYDFAVILLDVQMPEIDGFETAELIRRSAGSEHIPILFIIAAGSDERDFNRGYQSGAVDYIVKPVDPLILLRKVSVFAELHLRSRRLQMRAETASNAKTRFLANMSHEIRTPLNSIMGFTELLLDPEISKDERRQSITIVRRNCQALLKIVDEMLDIAKVESGGLSFETVETTVTDFINDVKATMAVPARDKAISLEFEMASPMPVSVITDTTRLRQILINMIGNAIKFTRNGRVWVEISLTSRLNDSALLHFKVNDTGVGIHRAAVPRLFQPFSQGDASSTRIFGGTGLGLALARKLARALGGDVRLLDSVPGKGSSFEVIVAVEVPVDCEWTAQSRVDGLIPAMPAPAAGWEALRGKHILLVEDAEDNQFLIKQFLSRTGAIVDTANNGLEGIQKALSREFDVILMDIQMPIVDGYQATKQLRQVGYSKPIIALTAHALTEERERCIKFGCNSHLTKPIGRDRLLASLVECIRQPKPDESAALPS